MSTPYEVTIDADNGAAIVAPPGSAPARRESLAPNEKRVFDVLRPAALALVASDGPVSVTVWNRGAVVRRIGHERGVWPARLARTESWRDTVTPTWDRDPFVALGVRVRLWCPTAPARDRFAEAAAGLLSSYGEAAVGVGGAGALRDGYQDLGADLDLGLFELELVDIAGRLGIVALDDAGCRLWLTAVHRAAERISRTGEVTARLIEIAAGRVARREK